MQLCSDVPVLQRMYMFTSRMPAGRVVWTVLAVTALTACPNGVTSQGSPTLESDGWTPGMLTLETKKTFNMAVLT